MPDWVEQEAWRQEHRDEIERTMRPVWVLWLACLSEPVILAVVVFGFGFASPWRQMPRCL